jgi:hypothetical protein
MDFGRVLVMIGRMEVMPMSNLGMVGGFFISAGLVMLRCFAMMLGRLIVMMGRLFVVFVNFRHCFLGTPRSMKDR